jgi:hypothetical protein
VVRDVLGWLVPRNGPGGRPQYYRAIYLFGGVPAAGWLLSMLPLVYSVLVGLVALAVLLAWVL